MLYKILIIPWLVYRLIKKKPLLNLNGSERHVAKFIDGPAATIYDNHGPTKTLQTCVE